MDLPSWLDAPKIAGLSVLVLVVVQYFKTSMEDKYVKWFSVVVGIALSFGCELYIGATPLNPVKAIINGLIATVTADTAYKFLSNSGKSTTFTLPSRDQMVKSDTAKEVKAIKEEAKEAKDTKGG